MRVDLKVEMGHWGLSVSGEVIRKSMVHDSTPPLGAEPLGRSIDMFSQHKGGLSIVCGG